MKLRLLAATLIAIALALSLSLGTYRGQNRLIVSTTTSLYDAGLLDFLAERYFELYQVRLDFIASGTGQALEQARNGDADVVLTHSPGLEQQFLMEGVVGVRKIIAYNYFIVVGPPDDPANIRGLPTIGALTKIAALKATWVSRGDNSGTHLKEKTLWKKAGIEPYGQTWYIESGSGMGQTLGIASEKRAYTLTDTGTYLRYRNEGLINLDIIIESGEELLNVYSVMAVNPERSPKVNFDEALNLIKFLVSDAGQALIGEFGVEDYGTALFLPAVPILKNSSDPVAGWIRDYAFIDNSECPPEFRLGQEELYQ